MSDSESAEAAKSLPDIKWVVSSSPHIRAPESTARIMWSVAAALAPAGVWAVYIFGWAAFYVICLSVGTALVTEGLVQRLRGRPMTLFDGSAVVTGLLLAYVLPAYSVVVQPGIKTGHLIPLKWYVPVVGAAVAIAIAKHCFGGLGHNIWNPALIGRAFVQFAFPDHMNPPQWPWHPPQWLWPIEGAADGVTSATSLAKSGDTLYGVGDLFWGLCPGSLGEISAFLLILGALYLIIRKYVNWRLPLGYLVTLVVLTTLFALSPPEKSAPLVGDFVRSLKAGEVFTGWLVYVGRQLFSGGVIIGALFMATDMVTSPLSSKGQLVFGIGCGILTALIRFYSGYPEGVCYAILLMNTVRPYVDRFTRPRVLGESKGRPKN